jgi:type II secretory pathway pseudopilin PulG
MTRRGFTILEMVFVIAIIILIAATFTQIFQGIRSRHGIQETAVQIIGMIHEARAKTLSGTNNVPYGIHFESGKVSLYQGATYSESTPTNDTFLLPPSVHIGAITFTGGATDVVFAQLTGIPSATGTIRISLKKDAATNLLVTIDDNGAAY